MLNKDIKTPLCSTISLKMMTIIIIFISFNFDTTHKCRRPCDEVMPPACLRRLSLSATVNDMSHTNPNYIYDLHSANTGTKSKPSTESFSIFTQLATSWAVKPVCVNSFSWNFLLTHAGKCRASDSRFLISRFLVETPEPVGGPELEKRAFFLYLPLLSMET